MAIASGAFPAVSHAFLVVGRAGFAASCIAVPTCGSRHERQLRLENGTADSCVIANRFQCRWGNINVGGGDLVSVQSECWPNWSYRTTVCGDNMLENSDRHNPEIMCYAICDSKLLASEDQLRDDVTPARGIKIPIATEAGCLPD